MKGLIKGECWNKVNVESYFKKNKDKGKKIRNYGERINYNYIVGNIYIF